jgi:hypothetical protein
MVLRYEKNQFDLTFNTRPAYAQLIESKSFHNAICNLGVESLFRFQITRINDGVNRTRHNEMIKDTKINGCFLSSSLLFKYRVE